MSDGWLNPSERDGLILECPALTSNEKLVLWAIGHHMCRGNDAWPSQARIAALTALSHKTVKRVVRALGGRGVLLTRRAPAGNRVNHYSVAWDWLHAAGKRVAGGVTGSPRVGHGDPTPTPEQPGRAPARRIPETPGRVTESPREGHGDTPTGSRRPPEGERNGPPKGKQKGLPVPLPTAEPDEGGRFDQEDTESSPELVEVAGDACPIDRDAGSDGGDDPEPDMTLLGAEPEHPPAPAPPGPRPTLADRIRELADMDADALGEYDRSEDLGVWAALPPPAVDPELEEARAYHERREAQEKRTLALAKQLAVELDQSLAKARDLALPAEKRAPHAGHLVRGVEKLAEMVGHRVRVHLLKSAVRFCHWSDECLAALEQLAPEVRTWDLFLGLAAVSEMEQNCWRVAVKENVWPDVVGRAEWEAGERVRRELGIFCHGELRPLDAVRKYRAGLIDRNGERVTPPVPAATDGRAAAE